MSSIGRILVAVDFSRSSKTALQRGARLAAECGAVLEIAHAIRPLAFANAGTMMDVIRDEAEQHMKAFAADAIPHAETKPEISILEGKPATALTERARASGADMIVVGAHGGHILRDLFADPTAISLMRQYAKPVLMVKREPCCEYERVLVATDFSAAACVAAKTAARMMPRAGLFALHVYEVIYEGKMQYANCDKETIDYYRTLGEMEAKHRMAAFISALGPTGRFVGLVRHGYVSQQILEYVEASHTDLLVLGVTHRSAISSMLLGSVTSQLVQTPSPDLLLVPVNDG